MRKTTILWLSIQATALAVGCGGDGVGDDGSTNAPAVPAGSTGASCYPNGTCDTGLACAQGVCIHTSPEPAADSGFSDADGGVDAGPDSTGSTPVCEGGCGANGRCVAPGECECDDGSAGADCSIRVASGFSFAVIAPGTFSMGSPTAERGRGSHEKQHSVTLTRAFLMQSTEVTQGQWKALSGGATPSNFSDCVDNCPVERVDWHSAVAFANALSVREGLSPCYTLTGCSDAADGWNDGAHSGCSGAAFAGLSCTGYRLPTESEWEYAARADTTTATYAGNLTSTECDDATLPPIAWFCGNSDDRMQSVATRQANAWGLYDMLGNVWEWTWDWYGTYPGAVTDPLGPSPGSYRVLRGGIWNGHALFARAAGRGNSSPDGRGNGFGFRLARSLP